MRPSAPKVCLAKATMRPKALASLFAMIFRRRIVKQFAEKKSSTIDGFFQNMSPLLAASFKLLSLSTKPSTKHQEGWEGDIYIHQHLVCTEMSPLCFWNVMFLRKHTKDVPFRAGFGPSLHAKSQESRNKTSFRFAFCFEKTL